MTLGVDSARKFECLTVPFPFTIQLHDNRVTLPESEHEDQGDMPSGSWSTLPQHPLPVVQEQSSLMDTTQSV